MPEATDRAGWVRGLLGKRPAESVTALTGGLGLLLTTTLGGGEDARTALVVVVAALPGAISFLFDLGRFGPGGRGPAHRLTTELDELTLRALHRARMGHPGWEADLVAVNALLAVEEKRAKITASQAGRPAGTSEATAQGAGK